MKIEEMVEAARRTLRVVGWTPSRLGKWKECPRKVLLEDLMKMCPVCFRGKISGGFDGQPVVCDTCSRPQPEREALERGNRLDAALTAHVVGKDGHLKGADGVPSEHEVAVAEATRHPKVKALVESLKRAKKNVRVQESIVLDSRWRKVSLFTRGAWARLKLDVLWLTPKVAKVKDWKSGNIDKRTNEIRERPEYHDAMLAYQIATLSVYPQASCEAEMVFIDAPPKLESPFKSLPVLKRADLDKAKEAWEKKIAPMMNDDVFPPRPGMHCNWCPFSKTRKGGPCPY